MVAQATLGRDEIADRIDELRRTIGVGPAEFDELTIGEVTARLYGNVPTRIRHTRGDIAAALEHVDLTAALRILENLYESGPGCVAWGDEQETPELAVSARERADDERQTEAEERDHG